MVGSGLLDTAPETLSKMTQAHRGEAGRLLQKRSTCRLDNVKREPTQDEGARQQSVREADI